MKRIVVAVFLALLAQRVDAQPDDDVQQPEPAKAAPAPTEEPGPAPADAPPPTDAPAPAPPPTLTSAPAVSEPRRVTSRPAERSLLREAGYGALFGIGAAGAVALTAVIACWRCTTTSPQETALLLGVVGGYVAGSIGLGAGVAYAGNRDGVVGSRGA
ncbi:MAG TPA: hypothetical protein VFQ65_18135, partial [Kofleriaceae bacterium]|nr:hypothetical protein [Kofleriaceae bacterium]